MPDDDRFSRYLSPAWRKVLRSMRGHDPVERVSDLVARALAATVRTVHGIPSLPGLAERMREAAVRGVSLQRVGDGRHVPTQIAEQAAAALVVTKRRELAQASLMEDANLLARQVLSDLACHYGFDRMVQPLLSESYTVTELRAVMSEVLADEQVSQLATRFLSRPSGKGLRAPKKREPSRQLVDLLDVDLGRL